MINQFIVIIGDIEDGHEFIGPFDDSIKALEYIEENKIRLYLIVKLKKPIQKIGEENERKF